MSKEVEIDSVIDIMLEKLDMGGKVTFSPKGTSMQPMLRDGMDVVTLKKPNDRLHLFDVALFKRESGEYVLHRVVDFDNDGCYVFCGDNQFKHEHGIKSKNIIAIVDAFCRKGKVYSVQSFIYRAYENFWYYTKPIRYIYRILSNSAKRVMHKIFPKDESKNNEKTTDTKGKN